MNDRKCVDCGDTFSPTRANQRRCQCCIEDARDAGRNVQAAARVAVFALKPWKRERLAELLGGLELD